MTHYYRRSIDPRDQYRRWIDPRVRSLRLADVIAYLERRGWKRLAADRKGFLAFQEPGETVIDGHPVCQFAPDAEGYDNYGQLMFELLTGLAEFEGRQASDVIDDIVGPRDVPTSANGPSLATPAQPAGRAS
jgi:hypothetical protein